MNYSIIKELGRGGMATVYLAEHKLLKNKVALKVLSEELVRNKNIRNRFLSEAKNLATMSHPNIIKVTDLIDDGDTVAFVMEHIDGETLKENLDRKGKLNDDEIRYIFSQMLDAVCYVHEQGLIHRDIKPSNFMIDKKGKVKLLDFGIAKNTDSASAEYTQTGTGMQMGTPMYMSPEQITETKSVTAQSDIYSLGVVLWQLVTGEKPYNTATLSNYQLQTKILNEALSATGSAFDAVIKKATEKEAANRFLNAHIFLSALNNKSTGTEKTFSNTILLVGILVLCFILCYFIFFGGAIDKKEKSNLDIEMVDVEGGTFTMGCTVKQENYCESDEKPAHKVTLNGFKIGKYEVTQAQWKAVMGNNPSHFSGCDNCPVENVSWNDVQEFIIKLNEKTGKTYRLPTEAEWEFAARGGKHSKNYLFSGGNNLDDVGWFKGNSENKTHEVGRNAANELGIYDMSGNVWEWCQDWHGTYNASLKKNPQGATSGKDRVLRGGSWGGELLKCRVTCRAIYDPDNRGNIRGFRLALTP